MPIINGLKMAWYVTNFFPPTTDHFSPPLVPSLRPSHLSLLYQSTSSTHTRPLSITWIRDIYIVQSGSLSLSLSFDRRHDSSQVCFPISYTSAEPLRPSATVSGGR